MYMDKLINSNASPKRAYCLYGVSTLGQVEKDDIPMQKQCCRKFAETQGWTGSIHGVGRGKRWR
ncbi:hypothetical protein OBV_35020 [Oscillibacter valericigenes Sjm18-20]|nr:hypothetical protein OBV_35020 [Oscillibacter valericigenes Sjm18-20]